MANDVIRYDSQCMDELHTRLSSLRRSLQQETLTLRMLNLTRSGADVHHCKFTTVKLRSTGTKVSSGLTPVVLHQMGSALTDLADQVERLQKKLRRVAELFEACETGLTAYSLPEPDILPTPPSQDAAKTENLDAVLTMLRNAPQPYELSSVMFGKLLCDNPFVQLQISSMALVTGNFTQIDSIPTDIYNHTMYAYSSFFDSYVPDDFKPMTMDEILGLEPDNPYYDNIINIIKLFGVALESDIVGPIGSVLGAVGDITDDIFTAINQYHLLQCMDKESALARAKLYQDASDLSMKAVGATLETLLRADPSQQIAILCGTTAINAADSIYNTTAEITLSLALSAIPGVAPVLAVVDTVTSASDIAFNTSSIPELVNNMTYSADIVCETYSLYEKAFKAYEANPSEATLKQAVTAYEAYQNAIADSYNTVEATIQNFSKSTVGDIIGLDNIQGLDQAAKASEHHRRLAQTIKSTYNNYNNS